MRYLVKLIKIPWASWQQPGYTELSFPDSWNLNICSMKGKTELTLEEIKKAVVSPINAPDLRELGKGKKSIVIAVDDMSRNTPVSKILPFVLEELKIAGIKSEQITILMAIGAHRPLTRQDFELKLGKSVVEEYNIENHHPYENLISLGNSSKGTPIEINKTYYEADLKIAIGGVIPHPLAGFGGGAKIVLPGLCGIKTLEANHSAAVRGIGVGLGRVTGVREDIEATAVKVGLDYTVCVVLTEFGGVAGIFSGHYIDAHRKAMELAKEIYSTKIVRENQICFFNSYPEDTELNQSIKSFNFIMTAPSTLLDKEGAIVIMTSSHEGKGYHSLLGETGAKLYKNFGENVIWKAVVKKKSVYLYSPNVSEADVAHYFPKGVKLFNDWNLLILELSKRFGKTPKVSLYPSSIQLAE